MLIVHLISIQIGARGIEFTTMMLQWSSKNCSYQCYPLAYQVSSNIRFLQAVEQQNLCQGNMVIMV